VYDASQALVVRSHGFRLEATRDAYFANDQIGVRAIARVNFAVPNPTAVVRIVGVL
jgi:HK97 family phage major capsid protein